MEHVRGWWRVAVAVVTAAALAACSSLIPPIAAKDLFGIDGVQVELTAVGGEVVPQQLLDPTASFAGTLESVIVSDGFAKVPGVVGAKGMEERVLLASNVTVSVSGDHRGEPVLGTFTIVTGALSIVVKEGATEIGSAAGSAVFSPGIPVVPLGACAYSEVLDVTTCNFVASVDPQAHAIVVEASAASARAVFDALRDGGSYGVEGEFAVMLASPGLTASAVVKVELSTSNGVINF